MSNFIKYQHVVRLGDPTTKGILNNSKVYVTPKIDGTNASIWVDENGEIACGSRTRQLTETKDNAGFYAWVHSDNEEAVIIREFLAKCPEYRIFGEFTGSTKFIGAIKDYNSDALGQLWIFDVMISTTIGDHYLNDEVWRQWFEDEGLSKWCVPILAILDHPSMDEIAAIAKENTFLLDHANHAGEGVVVRAADWKNNWGVEQYGKIVLDEYKQEQKVAKKKATLENPEQYIIDNYLTDAEISKGLAKLELQFGEEFDRYYSKHIGYILNICWTDSVLAEVSAWVKKLHRPTIDFNKLKILCDDKVKKYARIGC